MDHQASGETAGLYRRPKASRYMWNLARIAETILLDVALWGVAQYPSAEGIRMMRQLIGVRRAGSRRKAEK